MKSSATATNARSFAKRGVSQDAMVLLDSALSRAKERSTPIRQLFIRRDGRPISPLVDLLRRGRGEAVSLKLYLAIILMSAMAPHDTHFPARVWAQLLDLEEPEGRGIRRIRDSIDSLTARGLISVENRPGHAPAVTLCDDGGRRKAYTHPADNEETWVPLPPDFWRNGWICVLSGASLATLLVLWDWWLASGGRDDPFWISPSMMKNEYGLSDESRLKGVKELERRGLLSVARRNIEKDPFRKKRIRNMYRLELDRFGKQP